MVAPCRSLQRQHDFDPRVEAALSGDWTLLEGAAGGGGQVQQQLQLGGPGTDPSARVPVTCVNLLHANPKKLSELMLSEHFHEVRMGQGLREGRRAAS